MLRNPVLRHKKNSARFIIAAFSPLAAVLSLVLFLPSPLHSSAPQITIKVLVLEENSAGVPDKNEPLELLGNVKGDFMGKGTNYSGTIEVWKGTRGLYIVNELPLEDYVESVVVAEVGTDWDIEALKAQAVIARTYAVHKKMHAGSTRFHITSSVLHQVYKGNNPQIQIAYAVRETAGEILTYHGKPIEALYHSTSGGRTENPEEVFGKGYPYLTSVETNCELSPYWVWERKVPLSEIEKTLNTRGIKGMTIESYTSTGRVKEIALLSESGQTVIKATEFRKLLGWSRLPSTHFSLKISENTVIFEGKGYGHGVGLCQWSALQMARDGKKYTEILSFFYPGTEIRIYEGN